METAMNVWNQMEGKPFKFATCTRILQQVPKFNPMLEDVDEEEEKKPAANPVGKVMGDTIERPIGNRKAKKQKLLEKLDMSSVTSNAALESMAKSSEKLSEAIARRQKHDSYAKRAELYLKMGQEEKAMELLAKMEEDDNKPYVSEEKTVLDVPDDIEVDIPAAAVAPSQFSKGGNDSSDSDNGNPTLQAACNPALDSDDDDESDHPSQPSDDSW